MTPQVKDLYTENYKRFLTEIKEEINNGKTSHVLLKKLNFHSASNRGEFPQPD